MANFDYMGYNQKKQAAGSAYGASVARNAYARFLSQQRGSRKKFDFQQQTEKLTPQVVSSFTKRGLAGPGVRSGIYEKGLTDFAQQRFQGASDINQELSDELEKLRLDDAQAQADYGQQLAALEADKQAAISKAAATLTAFKPFLS